jgi:Holliday junction resolvasome RuvABC endonuclease subunit
MKILGIDPGMTRLGFGVVQISNKNVLDTLDGGIQFVTHGMVQHPRDANLKFNQHLNKGIEQICVDFPRFLDLVKPNMIVAETVPTGRLGSNTELIIAAITTCKVIAYQFGIQWNDMAANTIKKQVTDDGKANKTKIRNAVLDLFPIVAARHATLKAESKERGEKPLQGLPQDVFDAIATAYAGARVYGRLNELD